MMVRATVKERKRMRIASILKYKSMIEVINREHLARGSTVDYTEFLQDIHKKLKGLGYDWETDKVKPFKKWVNDEPSNGTRGWKSLEEEASKHY